MNLFARSSVPLVLLSLACSTPAPATDASSPVDANDVDAAAFVPSWQTGPDYPDPIAFGAAMILPGNDGSAYLYVIGGASGSFSNLPPFHAEIRRARLGADNGLGPWQSAGSIGTGSADVPLAGHGALKLFAEDGSSGMGIAGGGGTSGTLPVVLAGYEQVDGSIGGWGGFDPVISAMQGGHVFGSFNAFEAHQLALVGGLVRNVPSSAVIIAATMPTTPEPLWRDGPALPAARFGHGSVQVGAMTPDIFLLGGGNDGGPIADVLVCTRDATTLDVDGWAVAGTLSDTPFFPQTALVNQHVYVIGGLTSDPGIGDLSTRVRVATASHDVHGALTEFTDVAGAELPEGRAAGLVASVGPWVYIVGGVMGADHAASTSVIYARLEP